MAVFEASISTDGNIADAIRCVRLVTMQSISEIRRKLNTDLPVVSWDSHQFPPDMDPEQYNAQIMHEIHSLLDAGLHVRFQYRPAPGDPASPIELDAMQELLAWEVDYENECD